MTSFRILSWHGIPMGVKAADDGGTSVDYLPQRFQAAIDAVATKTGHAGYEAYLAGFAYSDPEERAGTPRDVARAVAAELAERYPAERVRQMCEHLEQRLGSAMAPPAPPDPDQGAQA